MLLPIFFAVGSSSCNQLDPSNVSVYALPEMMRAVNVTSILENAEECLVEVKSLVKITE
jgi:hypothetical protein